MSFAELEKGFNFTRGNNSNVPPIHTSSQNNSEFIMINNRISGNIFKASNNITAIQRMIQNNSINNPKINEQQHKLTEEVRQLSKEINADLKLLNSQNSSDFEESSKKQKDMIYNKLSKDFKSVLKRFQEVSKLNAQKNLEIVNRAKNQHILMEEEEEANENDPLLGSQNQIQIQVVENELNYNESLINERENELKDIERSMIEINEIFRDLGTMVNDQQYLLDNIESNVIDISTNIDNANSELRIATNHQKKARQKMFYLILIAILVGLILLIAVIS
ncbi:t-SNARE [Neocallimastix lanati (nom. inval.)]|jgi:syntaxin 7|uniref:t-SNARE n=1 Tax=Neocallimastix californiae TaxID=1754190 RepID=A0A1Y2D4I3_9FUNG|nr:t-SNARE [Neocallimastix sp. JGI-2020a]ORY54183.1 t-SNARE [Neocallimastix californiae]|eukprot:ORY54183.1 t-SNARE [Neocallimastix californiae]